MPAVSELNLALVILRDGAEGETIPLKGGKFTFGRDAAHDLTLPDASVSRNHAELAISPGGVQLRDLGSRNGIRVNRVPRKQANLLPGDTFEIGVFTFRLKAGAAQRRAPALQRPSPEVAIEQTVSRAFPLPQLSHERQLSTIYHACFWLTESTDPELLTERLARLLCDATDAVEAQFYSADLTLRHRCGEAGKPVVKIAAFLAEKFQSLPEAAMVSGKEIARHQRGVGQFNYLVGPIRRGGNGDAAAPFILLLRPEDWEPFTLDQRVLLQAVCQLWARETVKIEATETLRRENQALKLKAASPTLLGQSDVLQHLRQQLNRAAATKATILLDGETGSGKEVVAQFIHESSPRAAKPFVKVNCAAIPDGLIESELFGHQKGAFTDAKDSRKGKFLQANGGTLFLDEIGEMPLSVQAKVLRALENGEIEPLGSEAVQKVDVRVIAATHRNLAEMVERKEFRQDLYFRLNVFNLGVPPLREHAGDIAELARHFLEAFCRENGLAELAIAPAALALLEKHQWPGNVRELRNVIQRCAIVAAGPTVLAEDVKKAIGVS